MRRTLLVLAAALAVAGCQDRRKAAIEKVGEDQETIRRAGAAVNEVIRNAADCDTAKPLIVEADQLIADARQKVTVRASQQTLDALKSQVDRVRQACP